MQGAAAEAAKGAGADTVGGAELIDKVQWLLQDTLSTCQMLTFSLYVCLHCIPLCTIVVTFVFQTIRESCPWTLFTM